MRQQEPGTGIVFGIQRFSIHDGPGIRTTVFLKGCNVNCRWCHNPEGIPMEPLVGFNKDKCISCGACVQVCPKGCHSLADGVHRFDRSQCIACGKCVEACPVQALELIGKKMTVDDVMQVVKRDMRYYREGGGVTLSGGEALMQKDFALALLKRLKSEGIHCALETNGVHAYGTYEEVLPYVDLFLFDYKATDPQVHRAYVGCKNDIILENLDKLHRAGAKILVRCPIIPGVNDNDEHFRAIAQLTQTYPNLVGAEVLPYHKLGVSKAQRIEAAYEEFEMVPASVSDGWKQRIIDLGGRLVNVR